MKKLFILTAIISLAFTACKTTENKENDAAETTGVEVKETVKVEFPDVIKIENIAQNPEGIEYNVNDQTFFLSSINAGPIIKINLDGTYKPFTSGEPYPMSTAGLQIDQKNNRLLVAAFNGMELMDKDPKTKGMSNLRIYNLETGAMEKDINLSSQAPDAQMYFANDIAVDNAGNVYISDWYARVIYKVDMEGNASLFWSNETGIPSGPNGLDFHPNGYLLVSILNVNEKGLYADYGLVNIPLNNPASAKVVEFSKPGYTGFDGMVLNAEGNIVGVTNNGTAPGGNTLIEVSSNDGWKTAEIVHSKAIPASTTVAVTAENMNYVINQDFQRNMAEDWTIERIQF